MADIPSIVIGTRGSKLALAQTQLAATAILEKYPGINLSIKPILTKGDINQSPIPLGTVGKSWFTAEIEHALLNGEIDIAIHSLKDLPLEVSDAIVTIPILKRGDARDVLISKSGLPLDALPKHSVIGTDSGRRGALAKERRPDIIIKSIRGNIDTRIKKLQTEDYDALILAAAGLERLGMQGSVTEFFDPFTFIPAIGQGILAAQTRNDGGEFLAMVKEFEHLPTRIASDAEQLFSNMIGGGCKLPIGCYAEVDEKNITITAFFQPAGEKGITRARVQGPRDQAMVLAETLAKKFL